MKKLFRYVITSILTLLVLLPLAGVTAEAATLSKPKVTATLNTSTGKNKLSWEKVKNADYYIVQVTDTVLTKNKTKTYEVTGLSYTLSNTPGHALECKVKACKESGSTSSYSTVVKVTNTCAKPELKVKNVKNDYMEVSWAAISNASGYKVYAQDLTAGTAKKLLEVNYQELTYKHYKAEFGHKYKYAVVAICKSYSAGNSAEAVATITRDYPIPTLTAKNGSDGSIKITWDGGGGDAHKVQIYVRETKTGDWTLWKTCTDSTEKTLTYSNTKEGKTYYFRARSTGSVSAATSSYCTIVSCTSSLPELKITIGTYKGQPKLSWKAISGANKYEVARLTDSEWKLLKTVSSTSETATFSFTDTDKTLVDGVIYQYRVKAIGASSMSTEAKVNVMYRKVQLNTTEITTRVAGYCGSPLLTVEGTEKTVTWSSSNTSVVTVKDGDLSGKKLGTATITAKVDGLTLTCKVSVVEDSAYVDAFADAWIEAFIEEGMDDQAKLLMVSSYITILFQKDSTYTKTADVIYYGRGSTKACGSIAVLLLERLGFDAKYRSMSGDSKSMYPDGVKVGASYYNIKATKGEDAYYIACIPGGNVIYLVKNDKLVGYIAKDENGLWPTE